MTSLASRWLAMEPETEAPQIDAPPGLPVALPPGLEAMAQAGPPPLGRIPGSSSKPGGYAGNRPPPPPVPQKANDWLSGHAPPIPPGMHATHAPPIPPTFGQAGSAQEGAEVLYNAQESEELVEREPRKQMYETYLDEEVVNAGLASGRFIRGQLRVSSSKTGTAYVRPDGAKAGGPVRDVLVRGKQARNRAVHGDIVIVEMVDEDGVGERWRGGSVEDQDNEDEQDLNKPDLGADDDSSGSDEEVLLGRPLVADEQEKEKEKSSKAAKVSAQGGGYGDGLHQMCKVVAIAEKKGQGRVIVCTLHPNDAKKDRPAGDCTIREGDTLLKAEPTDKRMPWILLQINDTLRKILKIPGKLDKYKLWPVTIMGWKETSTLPLGRLKGQCLGRAGDLDAEEQHALIEHELDVHDVDFDDELLDEVDQIVAHADASFESETKKRHDLRHKRVFTIDPATAKDLDDAIHIDHLKDRNQVEVGVHIADVGHFLKMGSRADTMAQQRTTSVYLIGRVLPMLPHALCNHLCSLNPNEPKLAFSAFFRLDCETGDLIEDPPPWFEKTAIKGCCRLNYEEVQEVLDKGDLVEPPPVYGGHTWQQIKDDIDLMYKVCGKVRAGRFGGGALSISKVKMIFHTRDSEDGIPTDYHLESHSASHWIIEELMLLANRCVAKHLATSKLLETAVLRNHQAPDAKKAEALSKLLGQNLGVNWDASNAANMYKSCQAMYRKYGTMLGLCIEMMAMRSGMKQAEYFVMEPEADTHHFALNFEYYTHFTSPIRRYPDVMVHRVLNAILCGEQLPKEDAYHEKDAAENLVGTCNEKKSACRKCSDQIDRAVFCIFLRAQKAWFYTIGTVLEFKKDKDANEGGNDFASIYCSQLGRESKVRFSNKEGDKHGVELITTGVDDVLEMPETWRWHGRGCLELEWVKKVPGERSLKVKQRLQTLSCVPIVIIPTNTVPIDYAMFLVSPFHQRYEGISREVPEDAQHGFAWRETEEEGVELVHDALAGPAVI
jgi:protein SSD1